MTDHDFIMKHETEIIRLKTDVASIPTEFKEVREAQKKSDRITYTGIGILVAIQFIAPLILKK